MEAGLNRLGQVRQPFKYLSFRIFAAHLKLSPPMKRPLNKMAIGSKCSIRMDITAVFVPGQKLICNATDIIAFYCDCIGTKFSGIGNCYGFAFTCLH